MSNRLEITAETLPRFAKRLQKAIQSLPSTDIQLSGAYEVFAKSSGFDDLFELQNAIKKHANKTEDTSWIPDPSLNLSKEFKDVLTRRISVEGLIKYCTQLSINKDACEKSNIQTIEMVIQDTKEVVINIHFKDEEVPSLFLMFSTSKEWFQRAYLVSKEKLEKQLKLSYGITIGGKHGFISDFDYEFITGLIEGFFFNEEITKSMFMNAIISKIGLKEGSEKILYARDGVIPSGYLYPLGWTMESIKEEYYLAKSSFFDDNQIELCRARENLNTKETTKVAPYLSGLQKVSKENVLDNKFILDNNDTIILEVFKRPNGEAFCSRYICKDEDKFFLRSLLTGNEIAINTSTVKPLAYYRGQMDVMDGVVSTKAQNPYPNMDDPNNELWLNGYKTRMAQNNIQKKTKAVIMKR